jgi:hypothetical protein
MKIVIRNIAHSLFITVLGLSVLGAIPAMFAQVMSSESYEIERDSINIGGNLGSSESYTLEDTLGEVATGDSTSESYSLRAGYQQMDETVISFATTAANVTMTPALGGITGGTSHGTTTVAVYTNSSAGYAMTIKASSSPAMQGNTQGDTIADYTPGTAGIPDFTYSVPSSEEFGYTVSASTTSDLAQKFLDNGSTCNTGSSDTNTVASCWYGLSTTATSTIVRNSATSASGSTSSVVFKLTINPNSFVIEDTYTATTTFTAVAQ